MADLTEAEGWSRLLSEAWDCWGCLDILVNNAGADTLTGPAAGWWFERKLQELLAVGMAATMLLIAGNRPAHEGNGKWCHSYHGLGPGGNGNGRRQRGAVRGQQGSGDGLHAQPGTGPGACRCPAVNCLAPGWIRTAWGETASPMWQERVLRVRRR